MEKKYNKLVRDKIPQIIENNNEHPVIRILSESEYLKELCKKLFEESSEVENSKDSKEMLEELADVLEIIKSIAILQNSSLEGIIEIAREKEEKRGGFSKRIFLEKVR